MGSRIAVLDQHLTVADLLATRLLEQVDIDETSAHTRPEAVHRLLQQGLVDIVLVDWRLSHEHGSLVAGLLAAGPAVRILVVGNGAAPHDVRTAVDAGASGWVPGDVTFDELLCALRTIERGEFWVPGRVALWALAASQNAAAENGRPLAALTARERQVVQGMVDGLTRVEIARHLGMSPHTVRTHVHSVLHKFGVHSSLRAVAVARQAGLQTSVQAVPRERGNDTGHRSQFR